MNLEEQVQKLAGRGLDLGGISQASDHIYRIGYYRLAGYLHPFRQKTVETSDAGTTTVTLLSSYDPGTTLGKRSPFSHLDSSTFEESFVRGYKHGAWVAKAQQSHQRSHELFVKHFDNTYDGQLPIWVLTDLLELGQLAVLYSGFQREIATELADSYGVPTKPHFRSWLASINDVRNFSAHHARLFNRKLIHAPKRPEAGTIAVLEHLREPDSSKSGFGLYNVAAIMTYLLYNIEPDTTWPRQLMELVDQFPVTEHIGIESMGFPPHWEDLDLWATDIPS